MLFSAADLFLLPSNHEPCGINQLIAMRYGCIPVVREIGGLYDTVEDFNPTTGKGIGFTFKTEDIIKEDFARFAEDHPDLAEFYFGYAGDESGEVFDKYGGVDLFNPEEDMANLEEMKRKVRVMENKLKRKMGKK